MSSFAEDMISHLVRCLKILEELSPVHCHEETTNSTKHKNTKSGKESFFLIPLKNSVRRFSRTFDFYVNISHISEGGREMCVSDSKAWLCPRSGTRGVDGERRRRWAELSGQAVASYTFVPRGGLWSVWDTQAPSMAAVPL